MRVAKRSKLDFMPASVRENNGIITCFPQFAGLVPIQIYTVLLMKPMLRGIGTRKLCQNHDCFPHEECQFGSGQRRGLGIFRTTHWSCGKPNLESCPVRWLGLDIESASVALCERIHDGKTKTCAGISFCGEKRFKNSVLDIWRNSGTVVRYFN